MHGGRGKCSASPGRDGSEPFRQLLVVGEARFVAVQRRAWKSADGSSMFTRQLWSNLLRRHPSHSNAACRCV
eukprot:4936600-Pleurochrysis_carterae.AAC.3